MLNKSRYFVLIDDPRQFTVINDFDIGEIGYFGDGTVRGFSNAACVRLGRFGFS